MPQASLDRGSPATCARWLARCGPCPDGTNVHCQSVHTFQSRSPRWCSWSLNLSGGVCVCAKLSAALPFTQKQLPTSQSSAAIVLLGLAPLVNNLVPAKSPGAGQLVNIC